MSKIFTATKLFLERYLYLLIICSLLGLGYTTLIWIQNQHVKYTFNALANTAYRVLSQQMAQDQAILASVIALKPTEQQLAEAHRELRHISRQLVHLNLDRLSFPKTTGLTVESIDNQQGKYEMVQAADWSEYRLTIDLSELNFKDMIPVSMQDNAVSLSLGYQQQYWKLQSSQVRTGAIKWLAPLYLEKPVYVGEMKFTFIAKREWYCFDLPWLGLLIWTLLTLLFAWLMIFRKRHEHAQNLLRFSKIQRLNTFGEIASGLAHEINQPLTAILSSLQAAKRLTGNETKQLCALNHAIEQTQRAAAVIKRLRLSLETGQKTLELQDIEVNKVVNGVITLLSTEFQLRHIHCQVSYPTTPLYILVEPIGIELVLHNILLNAMQALVNVTHPIIQITLQASDKNVKIIIEDNGSGIASSDLARIFEPFYTTKVDGLGLGLSLCESLLAQMNGQIEIHSQLAKGTQVIITVPMSQGDMQ